MSWIYKIDSSKIILWVEFINIFIKNNFMSWIYKIDSSKIILWVEL